MILYVVVYDHSLLFNNTSLLLYACCVTKQGCVWRPIVVPVPVVNVSLTFTNVELIIIICCFYVRMQVSWFLQ